MGTAHGREKAEEEFMIALRPRESPDTEGKQGDKGKNGKLSERRNSSFFRSKFRSLKRRKGRKSHEEQRRAERIDSLEFLQISSPKLEVDHSQLSSSPAFHPSPFFIQSPSSSPSDRSTMDKEWCRRHSLEDTFCNILEQTNQQELDKEETSDWTFGTVNRSDSCNSIWSAASEDSAMSEKTTMSEQPQSPRMASWIDIKCAPEPDLPCPTTPCTPPVPSKGFQQLYSRRTLSESDRRIRCHKTLSTPPLPPHMVCKPTTQLN